MTAIIAKQNAKDKAFVGGGGEGSTDGLYNSLSLLNIDNIGLSLVICQGDTYYIGQLNIFDESSAELKIYIYKMKMI